ncbi:MAG: EVE domain-containing protein [Sphingomonadaceae bacterium]|nr:EVE domain-containing protein [Sphingomonadaceae bacterium]
MSGTSGKWLVKSEPVKYSWDDLVRDGETAWDGVRNNQAALYLKAMKLGDELFFYHSNEGLEIVGIATVSKTAYPDASDPKGRFVAVSVKPKKKLENPVSLARLKAEPKLAGMAMFRQFRLSVAPMTEDEWATVIAMSKQAG